VKILLLSSLIIASIMTAPAFAVDSSPQPLTRADCDKSGMAWNDNANVCGSELEVPSIPAVPGTIEAATPGQPLTKVDCAKAGMAWNDNANVCGSELEVPSIPAAPGTIEAATPGQPLTKADCAKVGMSWNDRANVCGPRSERLKAQAAPKVESAAQAERAKPNAARVAKQRRERHAHPKKKYKYRRRSQPAQPVERRPFRLFRNLNRPARAY
jgi:hypothetical protein